MKVLLAFLALAAAFQVPEGYVLTPYGPRPKACVLEVPTGAHIFEETNGLRIVHEIDGLQIESHHVPAQECHEDNILERYNTMRRTGRTQGIDAFPINGWLDNAGWYPPNGQNNLDSFVSTYTVPGNPPADSGQVLFFFIGMQDNAYSAVNIIQPVLTWGNGVKGWNLASWDCCPKNITVQSTTLTGFAAGAKIVGTLKRLDADTWLIDSQIVGGKNTTLYSHVGSYLYNWADVTQEVYSVTNCNQFATGAMSFSGLILKDAQQDTLDPKWSISGTTDCMGHEVLTVATVPQTITITHN